MSNLFFIGILLIYLQTFGHLRGDRVVCYFTNWSQYRSDVAGKFLPENIDPFLCTHIIYAFAKLNNSQLAPYEWNDDSTAWSKGLYETTTDLKKNNTNLKVLLAVGGWSMGSADFRTMVTNDNLRKNFVNTSVTYLKIRNFDGLSVDWEYPSGYKTYFTILLKELNAAFIPQNLLLTAAVAAGKSNIDASYEISNIGLYLDYINIMSYDYHGSWESFTGHNSPLYSRASESADQKLLNMNFTVTYYINNGFPKDKINVGLGAYGRSFKLSNPSLNDLGAPSLGPGTAGPITKENGFLSYYEICQFLRQGWTSRWNSEQRAPYAYGGDQWVGYDNIQSLKEKVDYIKSMGISGATFWAIDLDDFSGTICGQGKYPLINFVKSYINNSSQTTTSTKIISTSTTMKATSTTKTTKKRSSTKIKPINKTTFLSSTTKLSSSTTINPLTLCPNGDGYYPDISSGCQYYNICAYYGTVNFKFYKFPCPSGTLFDSSIKVCNWSNHVICKLV